ncbi:MAG: hypothetical protein VZQ47_12855, partial [Treponema sp.]|nr:hypothetical protein [Treponema sp.]
RLAQEWKAEQESKAYGQKPFFTPEATSNASSKEEDPVVERQQIRETEKEEDAFAMVEHKRPQEEEDAEDEDRESPEEKLAPKKPDAVLIETKTAPFMQRALEYIIKNGKAMLDTAPYTKICIKHHGRVYPIAAFEYRPDEDKIVCHSDEAEARVLG